MATKKKSNPASFWQGTIGSGMAALQNGEVDPNDAEAFAMSFLSKAGILPSGSGRPDPFTDPFGFTQARAPMPRVNPSARGSGLSETAQNKAIDEDTKKNEAKTQTQRLLTMSPEQFGDLYSRTESLPVFQEQKRGIQGLRDLLAVEAEAPTDYLSMPLAGLLESEFRRPASAFVKGAGPSASDQRQRILSYATKIQDDQQALGKSIFDAIGKQKGGTELNSIVETIAAKQALEALTKAEAEDPRKTEPKRGAGKAPDYSKDVKELGKNRATGATSIQVTLDAMNQELAEEGGLAGLRKSAKGVKGVGGLSTLVPIGLRGDKGARLYNYAMDLALAKLQLRSGAAASEKEAERYLRQLGLTPTSGGREMATGLNKLIDETQRQLYADEARFRPQVVDIYSKSPGSIISKDFDRYKSPPPAPKKKPTFEEWKAMGKPKAGAQ